MWNNVNILKIKSDYIIKSLFSFIEYDKVLKLIKNNKTLQNKLGFNIENYKYKSDPPRYEYTEKVQMIKNNTKNKLRDNAIPGTISISLTCLCSIIYFIYLILLVVLNTFDEYNVIDNYNEKSFNTINIINKCLFIYVVCIIIFAFVKYNYIFNKFSYDYGLTKKFKSGLIIFMNLVNFLFEGLVIWKLILSYQIKKDGITWFMVLDYLFLIFNIFYISIFIFLTKFYFTESGTRIRIVSKIVLTSYNNIQIENYNLPENFNKLTKTERKKYISDNSKNFIYKITKEEKELINSINKFRKSKYRDKLYICGYSTIPDFFDNESTEVMINTEQNIFKLSNKEYLFKYKVGIFKNNFNNDKRIIDILVKFNLNHIQIINQRGIEYIFVYEKNSCRHHETNFRENSDNRIFSLNSNDNYNSYSEYNHKTKNYSE